MSERVTWLRGAGLPWVLALAPPAAFLALCLALRAVSGAQVEAVLQKSLDARAAALAGAVAGVAQAPLSTGRGEGARREVEGNLRQLLLAEPEIVYAAILLDDGRTPLVLERSGLAPAEVAPDRLLQDAAFTTARFPVHGRDISADAQPAVLGPDRTVGYVQVGLSKQTVEEKLAALGRGFDAFTLGGVLGLLALSFAISQRLVTRPLVTMRGVAQRFAGGDLTGRVGGNADLAGLGESLDRLGDSLRETLLHVRGVTEGIAGVIERMSRAGQRVSEGAGRTYEAVEETSTSMEEILASVRGIAENVEVLAQAAEESSSSILEMAATNDEVAGNVQTLAASVEETTSAIETMTRSIKEVAAAVERLSAMAEETAASMTGMDVSISQVEMNANETARLSEQAFADAATGADALQKTLQGIDKIKDSSRTAADVIDSLGKRIGAIGAILEVIDEVAEQTNLLALNAAIIAAQAGEHGKGFAVVADEIKDLAERTGASTKEIAELIRSIQDESKNATAAMERGVRNVEEGVRLGGEAEGALKKIQDSAGKSTQMVKAIARATVEQARGSRQVTSAIRRIAETVQQVAASTAEQARGSEQIMKSAEKMKLTTGQVKRSSQEQAQGSRQITRSIESISEMVNHLNRAHKEQTRGSEQVVDATVRMREVAEALNASVKEMEGALESLSGQAETLRVELRRFQV